MRTGWGLLAGALGLGLALAEAAAGCSRTDPLDYSDLYADASGGGRRPDGGPRDADAGGQPPDGPALRDVRPPGDVREDGPFLGCILDARCDDGVACTADYCNKATGLCEHTPEDTSCAPGYVCLATTGCAPGSFAVDSNSLYGVALPAGTVAKIAAVGESFNDIALSPAGVLYGVTDGFLFTIDATSAAATLVAPVDGMLQGLDFGADGTLYGAGVNTIDRLDPDTGLLSRVADLPVPYEASGDVAILGATLYATATTGSTVPEDDILVSIDLTATPSAVTNLGPVTGYSHIWGLAAYEGALYGFTSSGAILAIDPVTAAPTVVAKPGETFRGATAR